MISNRLYWVADNIISDDFPDVSHALTEPDGLLAIGGDLSPTRLLNAYSKGIFPWYSEGQPIMWWSPDPRCVLVPSELKITRSLKKSLGNSKYRITFNQAFSDVIHACAMPRDNDTNEGTWITNAIKENYQQLHGYGYAHSVECWHEDKLVGGLYGIAIGKMFFGESMFSLERDTSKICLAHLSQYLEKQNFIMIDCQVYSEHLRSLGAKLVSREYFSQVLINHCQNVAVSLATQSHDKWPSTSEYKS